MVFIFSEEISTIHVHMLTQTQSEMGISWVSKLFLEWKDNNLTFRTQTTAASSEAH